MVGPLVLPGPWACAWRDSCLLSSLPGLGGSAGHLLLTPEASFPPPSPGPGAGHSLFYQICWLKPRCRIGSDPAAPCRCPALSCAPSRVGSDKVQVGAEAVGVCVLTQPAVLPAVRPARHQPKGVRAPGRQVHPEGLEEGHPHERHHAQVGGGGGQGCTGEVLERRHVGTWGELPPSQAALPTPLPSCAARPPECRSFCCLVSIFTSSQQEALAIVTVRW